MSSLPVRFFRQMKSLGIACLLFGLASVLPAQTVSTHSYASAPGGPTHLTAGPDGALWYTAGQAGAIGRISPTGDSSLYRDTGEGTLYGGITVGPDKALWFTSQTANEIDRITAMGAITRFPLPGEASGLGGITPGPDGALWFTEGAGRIGRITLDGSISEFPVPVPLRFPARIVAGSDGALWFTVDAGQSGAGLDNQGLSSAGPGWIGRVTTDGVFSSYPVTGSVGQPCGIASGPDGAVWFTFTGNGQRDSAETVGKITMDGVMSSYPLPAYPAADSDYGIRGSSCALVAGADGALWFGRQNPTGVADGVRLDRISTTGVVRETRIYTSGASGISALAADTDGIGARETGIWLVVTEGSDGAVSRVEHAAVSEYPAIATAAPLLAGTVSSAYVPFRFSAVGGSAPYTWSATGLPSGLSLRADGLLSGYPARVGTYQLGVTVTDSHPDRVESTRLFTLAINPNSTLGAGSGAGSDPASSGGADGGDGLGAKQYPAADSAAKTSVAAASATSSLIIQTVVSDLSKPTGVVADSGGNLYIADSGNNLIRMATPPTAANQAWTVTTVAGFILGGNGSLCGGATNAIGDGCPATSAKLSSPSGLALDSAGNLYIADTNHNRIRMVTKATGIITTVAGIGTPNYSGDGGPAISAELNFPQGIAVDGIGNLYIADTQNNAIRKATTDGKINTVVVGSSLSLPKGVAVDTSGNNLYIADTNNRLIRKLSGGVLANISVAGVPAAVALDSAGNLADIADSFDSVIFAADGTTIVAGMKGAAGSSGDGGPATSATLNGPQGVAVDANGNIFIADTGSNEIREVTQSSAPTITSLDPATATAGAPAFTLTVNGTNFAPDAIVSWGTTALPTTFQTPSQLTATVAAGLIASQGTVNITVTSLGNTSAPFTFTIASATPTITNLSPNSVVAGSAALSLTINGTNLTTDAGVLWQATTGTSALTPLTVTGGIHLVVIIPPNLILTPGTVTVAVTTSGGTSAPATFTITPGPPSITTVSPNSSAAGSPTFTLKVDGSNFTTDAKVQWGTTALPTTFVSGTQLTATVDSGLLKTAGVISVTVLTPNGTSPVATFTVTGASVPTITSLSPSTATAGSATFLLTINGTSFTSDVAVQWSSPAGIAKTLPNTFVSATLLTATVDSSLITTVGTAGVTVTNSKGTSPAANFTISGLVPTVAVTPSATSITTAQSLTVAVTVGGVSGQPTPTGSVTLTSGGYSSTPVLLIGGSAAIVVPPASLVVGTNALTVSYVPDPVGSATYTNASGTASVTVTTATKSTPTVTVTPSPTGLTTAQVLTVGVVVSGGSGSPAPSGLVKLTGGGYSSIANLDPTGSASITIPFGSLAPGADTLSVAYTPDTPSSASYNPASGAATVTVTKAIPTVTVTPSLSSISTAQSLPVAVIVNGGSGNPSPTGSVTLSSGGYTSGALPLGSSAATSGVATAAVTVPYGVLAPGTDTLTVNYSPDAPDVPVYGGASGTASLTVTAVAPSTPSVTVSTSSPSGITTADPLAVTVLVSGSPAPTGSVTLTSGTYKPVATPLSNGVAVITIPAGSLSVGKDLLTVSFTPDAAGSSIYNRALGTAPITVTSTGSFTVSSSGSITIGSGATSTSSTITVTPVATSAGPFTGQINLACSVTTSLTNYTDLPACAIDGGPTASLTISGTTPATATLTVLTTAAASGIHSPLGGFFLGGGVTLAGVLLLGIPARRRGWRAVLETTLGVFLLAAALGMGLGCGGSSSKTASIKNPGTTAGPYLVTVTGTDAATGTITSTNTVNVIVN